MYSHNKKILEQVINITCRLIPHSKSTLKQSRNDFKCYPNGLYWEEILKISNLSAISSKWIEMMTNIAIDFQRKSITLVLDFNQVYSSNFNGIVEHFSPAICSWNDLQYFIIV